jgi:hypothetical protein
MDTACTKNFITTSKSENHMQNSDGMQKKIKNACGAKLSMTPHAHCTVHAVYELKFCVVFCSLPEQIVQYRAPRRWPFPVLRWRWSSLKGHSQEKAGKITNCRPCAPFYDVTQCFGSALDLHSMAAWIRVRIPNTDPDPGGLEKELKDRGEKQSKDK